MDQNDLWEIIGDLQDNEHEQIVLRLFMQYEERLKAYPDDLEAQHFFNYLSAIIEHIQSCNVNRR
ncbi:MAG: hypothetical protein CSA33_07080 [Desulfobulbus propionicus]|nr:MAG: hypothetical protein CSA33_07080 [Desulfobulbus propionicus]